MTSALAAIDSEVFTALFSGPGVGARKASEQLTCRLAASHIQHQAGARRQHSVRLGRMNKQHKPPLIFSLSSFRGFNTGVGGHYRSVLEFSKILSVDFDVSIITFGDIPSPVYSELGNYTHVEASTARTQGRSANYARS